MTDVHVAAIEVGQNRLVLYPLDQTYRIQDPQGMMQHLRSIGFIENAVSRDGDPGQLRPGDNFMRHLTFLGCSPSIGSGNQQLPYNNYCISIDTSSDSRRVISGRRVRSPSCPACGEHGGNLPVAETIHQLEGEVVWTCPDCNADLSVETINWRNRLAIATHFIVVSGVFEGEAIPADKFLDQLGAVSGVSWSYCYC